LKRLLRVIALGHLAFGLSHVAQTAEPCASPIPIPEALRAPRLIIFGELHGTAETPHLVGEFACLLAQEGKSAIVGLEIPSGEQRAIDEYLSSQGTAEVRMKLTSGAHWKSQDGRASEGMLALIERIRRLRASGSTVSVLAIDGWERGAKSRDATMAKTLSSALLQSPQSHVVVLVGNLHAVESIGSPFDPTYESMAYHLASFEPLTLAVDFVRGAAWYCSRECGTHAIRSARAGVAQEVGIHLGYSALPGYDGTIVLNHATPSRPVSSNPVDGSDR
jgi:hypothetical protein